MSEHMSRSEEQLAGSDLSFHFVNLGNQTQVIYLDGKCLNLPSHH